MRFCEKLTKQRKANNLSQEILAEKIGVSRQAVSKWENGSSYPDMNTIIGLCKILNCNIEDLMDDGTIGKNEIKDKKFNFNNWINNLLSFITKSYNMFISMTFKQKIKCLLELLFIFLVILCCGGLLFAFFDSITGRLINYLPEQINYMINGLFETIYYIILVILGFIVFIHMFKIRYLDYFVTIEDENIKEKIIEKEVEKKELSNKHSKIIIRDPKHSSYNVVSGFIKLILLFIKFFVILISIPLLCLFVTTIFFTVISLIWIKYGILFFGIAISLLGASSLCYIFIELFYNFIFNQSYKFKKLFIIFISGLILCGSGVALSFTTYMNFDKTNTNYQKDIIEVDMNKNLVFDDIDNVKIDENEDNIKVYIKYYKDTNIVVKKYQESNNIVAYISNEIDPIKIVNSILNDLKNKKYRDLDIESYKIEKVVMNSRNYNILQKNIKNLYNE